MVYHKTAPHDSPNLYISRFQIIMIKKEMGHYILHKEKQVCYQDEYDFFFLFFFASWHYFHGKYHEKELVIQILKLIF